MYKKYFFLTISITIIFIIFRVYLYSEYVKTSYHYQKLTVQKELLDKNSIALQTTLQTFNSCGHSKKIATDVLGLTPLSLKQVYSLPNIESPSND